MAYFRDTCENRPLRSAIRSKGPFWPFWGLHALTRRIPQPLTDASARVSESRRRSWAHDNLYRLSDCAPYGSRETPCRIGWLGSLTPISVPILQKGLHLFSAASSRTTKGALCSAADRNSVGKCKLCDIRPSPPDSPGRWCFVAFHVLNEDNLRNNRRSSLYVSSFSRLTTVRTLFPTPPVRSALASWYRRAEKVKVVAFLDFFGRRLQIHSPRAGSPLSHARTVEHYQLGNTRRMTYIKDARAEMRKILDQTSLSNDEKKIIENHHAQKLMESFKNGITEGKKPTKKA